MSTGAAAFGQRIDELTDATGKALRWLTGLMALLTFVIVVLGFAFNEGAILLQEGVMYLHALIFMLGIPYALHHDAHVRVDLVYSRLSRRGRAWIDLIGHLLFLMPVAIFIGISSLPYVAASWRVLEGSGEVGGIPAVFLLKSLIPIMALLLALQGVAEIIRGAIELRHGTGATANG